MTDADTPQQLPPVEGPGRLLREARERKQLGQHAVADALHLRVSVVDALENDRYDQLPPATFSRGYLRAYAKLVEVPEHEVMAAFDRLHGNAEPPPLSTRQRSSSSGGGRLLLGILVLLVVVLAGLWAVREWRESRSDTAPEAPAAAPSVDEQQPLPQESSGAEAIIEQTPEPLAADVEESASEPVATTVDTPLPPATPPAPQVPAAAPVVEETAPAVANTERLTLRVLEESWMDIRDGEGNQLLVGNVVGPRTYEFTGPPPFALVIGNAAGVELELNGEPVDLRRYTRGRVARLSLGQP